MANFTCQRISASDTWPLRHAVLRTGRPLETCRWDGDDLPGTRHYGLIDGDDLVAIASLYHRPHEIAPSRHAWQLRGMAVHPTRQREGLGARLLTDMLGDAHREANAEIVWCNARTVAVPFYRRYGFQTVADEFDIPDVGPHFTMVRSLMTP